MPIRGKIVWKLFTVPRSEVGSAVLTAIATTIVSFLPVFAMEAAEGKLFRPLAFTKTFALIASVVVALTIIPPFAHVLFTGRMNSKRLRVLLYGALIVLGVIVSFTLFWWLGVIIILIGGYHLAEQWLPQNITGYIAWGANLIAVLAVAILLTEHWMPLGIEKGLILNFIFTVVLIGCLLASFYLFMRWYGKILGWCLDHKTAFLTLPCAITFLGLLVWLGFDAFFGWIPAPVKSAGPVSAASPHISRAGQGVHATPGRRLLPLYANHHAPCIHRRGPRCSSKAGHGNVYHT